MNNELPGLELLMNDKKRGAEPDNDNIEVLELELNELSDINNLGNGLSNNNVINLSEDKPIGMFNKPNEPIIVRNEKNTTIKVDDNVTILGEKTAQQEENKTWDGFKPFNEIPNEPTKPVEEKISRDQLLREKFVYLKRLENLEKKGVNLSQKYNIDSSLNEMKGEYEMIRSEKEKHNSVKFQAKMLMACITGVEFLNNRFDPFDINLDGWGENVNENVNDYDDVFAELHEKYKSKANIAPELKLLFMLGGSAVMTHMTNTMFKSAMPGMDDILKQNPELMQQFAGAAAQSMKKENTGFGNFMSDIMDNNTMNNDRTPLNRNEPTNKRKGVDISDNLVTITPVEDDNKNKQKKRIDMKGPSINIDNILSEINVEKATSKQESLNSVMFGNKQANRSPVKAVNLDL